MALRPFIGAAFRNARPKVFMAALFILVSSAAADDRPDRLRERDNKIRVKLSAISGAKSYWIQSDTGLIIESPEGGVALELLSDEPFQARAGPEPPGPGFFRIVLRRFPANEREAALAYAESRSKEISIPVRIIDAPDASKRPALAAVIGKFPLRREAERSLAALKKVKSASVILDQSAPFPGLLQVRSRSGSVAGQTLAGGKIRPIAGEQPISIAKTGKSGQPDFSADGAGPYRGVLRLFAQDDGSLMPVNEVDLEDFLRSVVPSEIGTKAHPVALKAQAVAARSEAIHKLEAGSRHGDRRYDFLSTQQDQVYRGVRAESEQSDAAVRQTEGVAMLYRGAVIDAVYSHSCGGVTASSEDLWPGPAKPYLRGKMDQIEMRLQVDLRSDTAAANFTRIFPKAHCSALQRNFPQYAKKYFRWKRTFSGAELSRRINDRGYKVGELKSLRVTRRASSGRVAELEIQGEDKTVRVTNGDTIRVLVGVLPSSFFTMGVTLKGTAIQSVVFHGAGYGHGVGMCQMGAYMLARSGQAQSYEEILKHYFSDVEIKKIY